MKDCKISDDGLCYGDEAKVAEYEEKQRDPIIRMRFPYLCGASADNSIGKVIPTTGDEGKAECLPYGHEFKSFVAYANLAPLVQELFREKDKSYPRWRLTKSARYSENGVCQALWKAFEEASISARKL